MLYPKRMTKLDNNDSYWVEAKFTGRGGRATGRNKFPNVYTHKDNQQKGGNIEGVNIEQYNKPDVCLAKEKE